MSGWMLFLAVWGFLILFLSLIVCEENTDLEFVFLFVAACCFLGIGWIEPSRWASLGLFVAGIAIGISGERLLTRKAERKDDDDAEA